MERDGTHPALFNPNQESLCSTHSGFLGSCQVVGVMNVGMRSDGIYVIGSKAVGSFGSHSLDLPRSPHPSLV